jgi:hypothetical protein
MVWAAILSVALLLANGAFVALEFALVGARFSRLEPLAADGRRSAQLAVVAMRRLNVQLAGAQLGITLAEALELEPRLSALRDGDVKVRRVVDTALALAGVRAGQRLLIASAGAADDLVAQGGDCEAPQVLCVTPAPLTTRGEARMAAHLADGGDWAGLMVVTSWWHGHRADLHLAACLSIPYRIVVAGDPTASPGIRVIWREALGALDARLRPECRDLAP